MSGQRHSARDAGVVDALGMHLRSGSEIDREELMTTIRQSHIAKKRNVLVGFEYFQGKLQTFDYIRKACVLALGEMDSFVKMARHEFRTKYNKSEYPEQGDLIEQFNDEPSVQLLDRKYRRLSEHEDDMIETVARIKLSLLPANHEETLESDDFIIVKSMEDFTLELTMRIRETEVIEMYISRILRHIRGSLTVIKTYHTIKGEKYETMTEEEIENSSQTTYNSSLPDTALFTDGAMRVLYIRHRDGIASIESRPLNLTISETLAMMEDDTDDEDETNDTPPQARVFSIPLHSNPRRW